VERTGNIQQKRRQILFERSFQMSTIKRALFKTRVFTVNCFKLLLLNSEALINQPAPLRRGTDAPRSPRALTSQVGPR